MELFRQFVETPLNLFRACGWTRNSSQYVHLKDHLFIQVTLQICFIQPLLAIIFRSDNEVYKKTKININIDNFNTEKE